MGGRWRLILEVAVACIAAIAVAVVLVSGGVDRAVATMAGAAIGGGMVALLRVLAVIRDERSQG